MVEHTEGDPGADRNGDSKTVLDTAMQIIQFLLVAVAVGMFLISVASIRYPLQLAFTVIGGGVIGAVLIEVIYFG